MTESIRTEGTIIELPGQKSVWLGKHRGIEDFFIQFERPAREADFQAGKVVSAVRVSEDNQRLVHQVRMTPEAAQALWELLNVHFKKKKPKAVRK